jgi:molecular chaperone GrpE
MKFKIPFISAMNKDTINENQSDTADVSGNPIADELNLASNVEASEQQPIEEDPTAKLEAEIAELKNHHMRFVAEFDNYKKRTLKERSELIKTAGADTMISLLPVLDDLERAIKATENLENSPFKEGILLIQNKLISTLEQRGLKPMNSIGEEFNVDLHEAITNVEVGADKKDKVIEELEKGYYLNDKVVRYAKVIVGK